MAYKFLIDSKIIICNTILDFIDEYSIENIDLASISGKSLYKYIFGHNLSINQMKETPKFKENTQLFQIIFPNLDEKSKRLFAGYLTIDYDIKTIAKMTSLDVKTIRKGKNEIISDDICPNGQIRKKGGGRKNKLEFLPDLEKIINNEIAGDPMSSKKWTKKTLRYCKDELKSLGFNVSLGLIQKGLKKLGFSLKKNKKYINKRNHPDRNTQFLKIAELKTEYSAMGWPIVSLDGKKKEKIGNFKNSGRTWRKNANKVNDHDYLSDAEGKLNPGGIYDVVLNEGYIYGGTSYDTPEFAVDGLIWWWENYGLRNYPNTENLLILADCGGSNSYRSHMWKYYLQTRFVDKYRIKVRVAHYPAGTSKYNPIEHRLFSYISINWAGEPLTSYEKALELIRSTKTTSGLCIYATLTKKEYEKGQKPPKGEMERLSLKKDNVCPKWNYEIHPRLVLE